MTGAATHRPAPLARLLSGPLPGPVAALLSVVLVVAALVVSAAGPAAATGPSTSSFLTAVNSSRAAAGLRPYSLQSDLSAVAYRWSQHMASTGNLQHNPSLASQVTNWEYAGENVGYGPDWATIEQAFMHSPAHRANILDHDFTQIGLGIVVADGRMWVTQVFRKPVGASTSVSKPTAPTTSSTTPRTSTTKTSTPARRTTSTRPASHPTRTTNARPATPASAVPTSGAADASRAPQDAVPASSPATPEQQLVDRISDARAAVSAAAPDDPVAQSLVFVRSMGIVTDR